jgi:hypothetical protein
MICPDCNKEMTKTAIQCSDLSGWMVGWLCECNKEDVELTIHAKDDWTPEVIYG